MDLTSKQTIRDLLKKYGLRPSKKLGQNFLIDKNVLRKILTTANLSSEDTILEIGPGPGMLTIELAKRVKKVIAVEKDRVLSQLLENILKTEGINNVKVMNKDILQISQPTADHLQGGNFKLIANLPYYITSPVIRKFLEAEHKPEMMVLMVQKEVAQRITAIPPKMNLLAVAIQFYAKPEIISYVSKKSFWPQPKVDSAIIKIVPHVGFNKSHIEFFKIVKIGFSSKRKMLKNNLPSTSDFRPSSVEGLGTRKIEKIFNDLGLNPKARAENLSIEDWLKLYEEIYKQ